MKLLFLSALQSYYAPIMTLFVFGAMIFMDKLFTRRIKHLILLEIGTILFMIAVTWLDQCLMATPWEELDWKLKTATTFLSMAFAPIPPIILVLIYDTEETRGLKGLFYLPVILNLILCLISIRSGWIFYIINPGLTGKGPLSLMPMLVSIFYLSTLIFFAAKQKDKPNRKEETVFLAAVLGIIIIAIVIENLLHLNFIVWCVSTICVILYFLLLTTQKILYDSMTGSYSRLAYERRLEKLNYRSFCTVAMIDLNNLKKLNDEYGHSSGDAAICKVTDSILKSKSRHMQIYRYGGDEFILLSNRLCEEEIRKVLKEALIRCEALNGISLSFAYGIAEYHMGDDIQKTILNADEIMYRYKSQMRENKSAI